MDVVLIHPIDKMDELNVLQYLNGTKGDDYRRDCGLSHIKIETGSSGISCAYLICKTSKGAKKLAKRLNNQKISQNQITATQITLTDDNAGIEMPENEYVIQEEDPVWTMYPYLPYYNAEGFSNSFGERGGLVHGKSKNVLKNLTDKEGITEEALYFMKNQYKMESAAGTLVTPTHTESHIRPAPKDLSLFLSASYHLPPEYQPRNWKLRSKSVPSIQEKDSSKSSHKHRHHRHHHHKHHHRRHQKRKHVSSSSESSSYSSQSDSNSK